MFQFYCGDCVGYILWFIVIDWVGYVGVDIVKGIGMGVGVV